MSKIIQFTLFFIIFFSVYSLMHYYIYIKVSKIFLLKHFWIIFITLAVSFPASMIIERLSNNIFTRAFYAISATWLGVAFFLLFGFLVLDLISLSGKINQTTGGVAVIIIVLVICVYSIFNSQNIRITKIEVPINNLPKESMKIVQLTDIHIGSINDNNFLKKLVDKTNELKPDIVVITGDLFDGTDGLSPDMISSLKGLKTKAYFVTGNHENYLGKEKAIKYIEQMNVTVLQNEFKEVKGIQLIGLSFPENELNQSSVKINWSGIDKKKPKILLYHWPVLLEGVDLQLSGHTHNGQIFPFNLLVKTSFKYIYGLYKVNNTYIYTSSGAGTWGPPMRFLTTPEIVEITLRKANN